MALSDAQIGLLEEAAQRAGAEPSAVVAAAETLVASGEADDHPVADRMLIGFLPYVTVQEFRTIWLKMDTPVPDWHLMTGEWLDIHGPQGKAPAGGEE